MEFHTFLESHLTIFFSEHFSIALHFIQQYCELLILHFFYRKASIRQVVIKAGDLKLVFTTKLTKYRYVTVSKLLLKLQQRRHRNRVGINSKKTLREWPTPKRKYTSRLILQVLVSKKNSSYKLFYFQNVYGLETFKTTQDDMFFSYFDRTKGTKG